MPQRCTEQWPVHPDLLFACLILKRAASVAAACGLWFSLPLQLLLRLPFAKNKFVLGVRPPETIPKGRAISLHFSLVASLYF